GVGWGSAVLEKRADRSASPLRWYGLLKLGIAVTAAASPLLLIAVRAAYLALGGSATLGPLGAAAVRLALGAVVLGIPTFLMGETLPAAIAARPDKGHAVTLSYGANAISAVAGVMSATFWLLENLGNHVTLWSACVLNVVVALCALAIAKQENTSH